MFSIATTNLPADYLFKAMNASELVLNTMDHTSIVHNKEKIKNYSIYGRIALIGLQVLCTLSWLPKGVGGLLFGRLSLIPQDVAKTMCISSLKLVGHAVGNLSRLIVQMGPIVEDGKKPTEGEVMFWRGVKVIALVYDCYSFYQGARLFGDYPGGWFQPLKA